MLYMLFVHWKILEVLALRRIGKFASSYAGLRDASCGRCKTLFEARSAGMMGPCRDLQRSGIRLEDGKPWTVKPKP